MSTIVFVALVAGSQTAGYRASFHDLPECHADGRDLSELLLNARQALTSRLEALEGIGEAWPGATPIEHLPTEPGAMLVPIDVEVDDAPIRVNVSLGERLVQRIDAAAEAGGMTRSGFIAQSVRKSLDETNRSEKDFQHVSDRLKEELAVLGRRINDNIGPESAFGRRMNELDGVVYDRVRKAADNVSAAMVRRRDVSTGGNGRDGETT